MMDLGQLRSFAEVAERGTVAAAAQARGYTSPAVSQHIAKLEAELGVALFNRLGRRLHLTDSGKALLPVALEMIHLEAAGQYAVSDKTTPPHVVVAGLASAISALLIPRIKQLRGRITLEIRDTEDVEALLDLRLTKVDVVLMQEYGGLSGERDPRLTFSPLATDQLRLALPARMPASSTLSELGDEPWLLNGHNTRCSQATTQILRAASLQPQISGIVADNDTLLKLVAAGHGVTIVPELLVRSSHFDITLADQDLGISRTIYAVSRSESNDSTSFLISTLQSDVRDLRGHEPACVGSRSQSDGLPT